MPDYTYQVEVNRYFIPTEEINSRGNPVCIPIIIRKMFLATMSSYSSENFPRKIKVVRFVRQNQPFYSISIAKDTVNDFFPLPKLRPDVLKYKKLKRMDEDSFLRYLTSRIGEKAISALHELITKQPDVKKTPMESEW
jgi:hypothetical protein